MRELNERPVCHRAEDLVTYLYGEAGETDARDLREHLQSCESCRSEFALFSQVHESILLWRNEALGSAMTPAVTLNQSSVEAQVGRRETKVSALAAVREFFRLSPFWLRGATAFAGLLLCVLIVLTAVRSWERPQPVANDSSAPKFSQSDMDKAVAAALAHSQAAKEQQPEPDKPKQDVAGSPTPRKMVATAPRSNRPRTRGLTQEEREQLAADLRLTPGSDDEELPFVISDQANPDKPNPDQPNQ